MRFHRPHPALAVAHRPKNASSPSRTNHPSRSRKRRRRKRLITHRTHRARHAPIVLPDTDAGIRRAEIDPDRGTFSFTHVSCRRTRARREVSFDAIVRRARRFDVRRGSFPKTWMDCVRSHDSSMDVWVCTSSHMLVLLSTRVWEYSIYCGGVMYNSLWRRSSRGDASRRSCVGTKYNRE